MRAAEPALKADALSDAAVEARAVTFSYPDGTEALSQVDFVVRPGEFVATLAANGSGKSTLLKVLVGLLKPQRGQVLLGGREVCSIPEAQRYQGIGIVFQDADDQLFAPTVEDDVAFGPRNLGLAEAEVARRVTHSLEAVGGAHLRARPIHHLSFGERKRVCVAGVIAMRPSVLILDEPTAGLDPAGEASMLRLLHELNREGGITVVLATHSVDLLPLFADRIYVLHRGRVLSHGTPRAVFGDSDALEGAALRVPHVTRLLHELEHFDGVPLEGLALTVGEARRRLLELIPDEVIVRGLK